jgi:hypothetical protein
VFMFWCYEVGIVEHEEQCPQKFTLSMEALLTLHESSPNIHLAIQWYSTQPTLGQLPGHLPIPENILSHADISSQRVKTKSPILEPSGIKRPAASTFWINSDLVATRRSISPLLWRSLGRSGGEEDHGLVSGKLIALGVISIKRSSCS